MILCSLDFAVHIVVNAVYVEDADGGVFFAEILVWPDQDVFIVRVWSFIVRSS